MGEIVAACGTVHAPQLIIRPPDEKPEMLDASIAAMRELGKILDEFVSIVACANLRHLTLPPRTSLVCDAV